MSSQALKTSILALSPLVYWPLDETSGSSFAQLGTSTVGPMVASGTFTPGGQQLIPNDNTNFLQFGSGSSAIASRGNISGALETLSVSYIIKFNNPISSTLLYPIAFGASGETLATNFLIQHIFNPSSSNFSYLWEYSGGTNEQVDFPAMLDLRYINNLLIDTTTWLITTVRDSVAKTVSLYINGRLITTNAYTNNPAGGTSTAAVFSLGNYSVFGMASNTNLFTMGHVCLFNRVLTTNEVQNLATTSGLADPLTGPVFDVVNNTDILVNPEVLKVLYCAIDPLIDISVAFPEDAYTTEL
jgi:hypothetical protein